MGLAAAGAKLAKRLSSKPNMLELGQRVSKIDKNTKLKPKRSLYTPEDKLTIAVKDKRDDKVYLGHKGDIHLSIADREDLVLTPEEAEKAGGAFKHIDRGWVTPGGHYLSNKQARAWDNFVNKLPKTYREQMGLESVEYRRELQFRDMKQKAPPIEKQKIGDLVEFLRSGIMPHVDELPTPNLQEMKANPTYWAEKKNKIYREVLMSPDEYMDRVEEGFKKDSQLGDPRHTFKKQVDEYAAAMKRGDKFPKLVLDYSGEYFGQEGRHRAVAAKKAGFIRVPVVIIVKANK